MIISHFSRWLRLLSASRLGMLLLTLWLAPALALAQAGYSISPSPLTAQSGDVFTVTVDLNNPSNLNVDALEVHLTFDPTKLEVVSLTDNPAYALPLIATGFDNSAGTITSVKGDFPPYLSASIITALTIEFRALDTSSGTPVIFQGTFPTQSQATSAGADIVAGNYTDGLFIIEPPCPPNVGTETINAAICAGETFDFFGQSVTTAGTQTTILTDQSGCDSVEVTLNLTVNPTFDLTESLTVCANELPIQFGSQTLSAAGTFTETFQSQAGCDSTVTLTLNVNPTFNETESLTVCANELPIQFGSQTLTAAGTFTETFQSQSGCDSTVTLTLNVNPTFDETETLTVCDSELPILFGSQTLSAAGVYSETFLSQAGCDSTVTLTLNVNPTFNLTVNETIQPGSSFSFGGQSYSSSTTVTETFQTVAGCDSVVTLVLDVVQTVELFVAPDTAVAGIGQSFSVDILVSSGAQSLDGFQLDMTFDPSVVLVDSITEEAVAEFPVPLFPPTFDNAAGTIDYARGVFPPSYPSGLIKLATVYLTAQSLSSGSPLAFVTDTDVTFAGNAVLTGSEDGTFVIVNSADLTLSYGMQGRTDLSGLDGDGFTVELYEPGTTTLRQSFSNLTGSPTGELTFNALTIDDYDVWLKHSKYLARLKNVSLTVGSNLLDMGTLLAGDANDDNSVLVGDFSIISSNFNLPSFDQRSDLDNDGSVGIVDFSLLSANFNTAGAVPGGAYSLRTPGPRALAAVDLAWTFAQPSVTAGETVTAYLMVQAGDQPIDGAEAHLSFAPGLLEVTRLEVGGKLPIALQEAYDNDQGTLDLAAGSLGRTLSGEFVVAEVVFRAKAAGTAELTFADRHGWSQHATAYGHEVLGQTHSQTLTIGNEASTDVVTPQTMALDLRIYPVPSEGQVTVAVHAPQKNRDLILTVYDHMGRKVLTHTLATAGQTQLDLSQQAEGVYRVQLSDGEQQISRQVIINR